MKCKLCNKSYTYHGGTTNLHDHLNRIHSNEYLKDGTRSNSGCFYCPIKVPHQSCEANHRPNCRYGRARSSLCNILILPNVVRMLVTEPIRSGPNILHAPILLVASIPCILHAPILHALLSSIPFHREEEAIKLDGLSVSEMKQLREQAEKFAFQAEVNRMMKLIINSLYRNKEVCVVCVAGLYGWYQVDCVSYEAPAISGHVTLL